MFINLRKISEWVLVPLCVTFLAVVLPKTGEAQVNISGHVAFLCNTNSGTGTVTFYSTAFTGFAQNYTVRIGPSVVPNDNPVVFSGSFNGSNLTFSQSSPLDVSHTVYISVTSGSFSDSKTFPVSRTNTPTAPTVTPASAVICGSGSQLITAAGGTGTFQWYRNSSPVSGSGNTYTATTAGNYTVTETNACGTSPESNASVITVENIPPKPSITLPALPLCDGAAGVLTANGNGGTYTWFRNGTPTGHTGSTYSVTQAGDYTIEETNSCGTSPRSDAVTVTTLDKPAAPAVTPAGPILLCDGGTTTLTANGTGGTYTWSTGATGSTLNVSTAGSYSVTESNACGASPASNVVVVTTGTTPTQPSTPSVSPAGPILLCDGGTTTLTASGGSGTYVWSTGAIGSSITVSTAGNYFVYSPGTTNGCGTAPNSANSNTVVVTTLNKPVAPSVTPVGPVLLCDGGTTTLTANGTGGTYTWSTGATGSTLSVSTAGSYSVTESNGCGASPASNTVVVTTGTTPTQPSTPSVSPAGPILLCDGGTTTLTASGGSGSYIWSNGANTSSITVSTAGNYFVYSPGTTNGCGTAPNSANSNTVVVTTLNKPVAPSVTPVGPILLCDGGSTTLTANGTGGTYTWSTGATGSTLSVSTAGSYSVTESNACGASPASNVVVVTTGTTPTQPSTPSVSPAGPILLCDGGTTTLTASGGNGSYVWSTGANTTSITVSTAGNYFVYSPGASNACGTAPNSANSNTVVITTNNSPVVSSITGANQVCAGSTINLNNSTPSGTWSSSNTAIATVNSSGVVTGIAAGSVTISYAVTNSCGTTTVTHAVTVNALPVLTAIGGPASVCLNGSVTQTNSTSGGTWSSSNTGVATINGSGVITTVAAGTTTITYTYTNANGCTSSVQRTFTVHGLPVLNLSATVNGTNATISVNGASSYTWSSGENTSSIVKPLVSTATYSVTGTDGNGCSSNDLYAVNATANGGGTSISSSGATAFCAGNSTTLTATASDQYYWNTGATTQSITVNSTGTYTVYIARNASRIIEVANITVTVSPTTVGGTLSSNATVCSGTNGGTLTLSGYTGTINNWEYSTNGGGSWNTIPHTAATFTYINLTTTTLYRAIVQSGTCPVVASSAVTITVNPIPDVFAISDQIVCNNASTATVSFNGSVGGTTYNWTNSLPTIGLAGSGTGNIGSFAAINTGNTPVVANISVTPTAAGCIGSSRNFSITVNPTPTINAIPNQVLCNNANTTAVVFGGPVAGTTYTWTNDLTSIGLAASGTGDIAAFTALNAGSSSGVATVIATPSANGCVGSNRSYTYTVHPTPSVNAISNQVVCNNSSTTTVSFGGPVSGTTYTWSNDLTSIGLAASGTGNIAGFTAINTGFTPVTANITATPTANGCVGPTQSFTITVNPTPSINAVSNQVVCNNSSTTVVAFGGPVVGTTYTWSNDLTSIGLAASGSGDIAGFTATNTGFTPVTANITITPSANGCVGPTRSFTITVNPTPSINAISNQVVCNNASTAAVTFAGPVLGTTYSWSNDLSTIGLSPSGAGNISSFSAQNTGTVPVTATITATPLANGCVGPVRSFAITVNPTPTINAITNQVLCNNANTTAVSFGGPVSGTSFTWTNTLTSIGLAASGTGNIPSFTALNTGTAPVTATITATPTANGCVGPNHGFTITVNPTPTVNAITDQVVCNNASTATVILTGSVTGTSFTWTNSLPSVGLSSLGGGSIATFTATNTGSTTVTANIVVTPTANGCVGPTRSFAITVHPTPWLTSSLTPPAICDSTAFVYLPATAVSGASFTWTRAAIPGINSGSTTNGTGNIAEVLSNDLINDTTVVYRITTTANGCSISEDVRVKVYPTPFLTWLNPAAIHKRGKGFLRKEKTAITI